MEGALRDYRKPVDNTSGSDSRSLLIESDLNTWVIALFSLLNLTYVAMHFQLTLIMIFNKV